MLAVTIRPFRPDELEVVARLWQDTILTTVDYVPLIRTYTWEGNLAYFAANVAAKFDIWVAQVDGKLAGFIALRDGVIDELFVDVGLHRQGVGTALLDHAKQLSPDGLTLMAFQQNTQARAFYEKHGFAAVRFGISPPPESVPDVEYRWPGASAADRAGGALRPVSG